MVSIFQVNNGLPSFVASSFSAGFQKIDDFHQHIVTQISQNHVLALGVFAASNFAFILSTNALMRHLNKGKENQWINNHSIKALILGGVVVFGNWIVSKAIQYPLSKVSLLAITAATIGARILLSRSLSIYRKYEQKNKEPAPTIQSHFNSPTNLNITIKELEEQKKQLEKDFSEERQRLTSQITELQEQFTIDSKEKEKLEAFSKELLDKNEELNDSIIKLLSQRDQLTTKLNEAEEALAIGYDNSCYNNILEKNLADLDHRCDELAAENEELSASLEEERKNWEAEQEMWKEALAAEKNDSNEQRASHQEEKEEIVREYERKLAEEKKTSVDVLTSLQKALQSSQERTADLEQELAAFKAPVKIAEKSPYQEKKQAATPPIVEFAETPNKPSSRGSPLGSIVKAMSFSGIPGSSINKKKPS